MPSPTIGQTVRERREAMQLTRGELARLAATSTSTVARLELTGHVPNPKALRRIAQVLDLSLDALLLAG